MQIAAEKCCWLVDLDDVPSEELTLWAAYYELEAERRKKAQDRADAERRSHR